MSVAIYFVPTIVEFVNNNEENKFSNYPETFINKMKRINNALKWIAANKDLYSSTCQTCWDEEVTNITMRISEIRDIDEKATIENSINLLMYSTFRLMYERFIRSGLSEDFDGCITEASFLAMLLENEDSITPEERSTARMLAFNLQSKIISGDIEKNSRTIIRSRETVDESVSKIEKKIEDWQKRVEEFDSKVEAISGRVDGISNKQNFISLAEAFRSLITQKSSDLKKVNKMLMIMGALVIAPLAASLILNVQIWVTHQNPVSDVKDKIIYFAPVIIPIEIILIYFFRIFLKEQLSLKAQILQLELRYSVCAFIKGYADFSKDIEKTKLDKFEALIFSGISPDPTAVPSTFDGMDQLLNIAKAAGGK